jgi:hypothetical protein
MGETKERLEGLYPPEVGCVGGGVLGLHVDGLRVASEHSKPQLSRGHGWKE